jgi:predicted P-loop ATPase
MEKIKIFNSADDFFDKDNLEKINSLKGTNRARLVGLLTLEAREHGIEKEFRELINASDEENKEQRNLPEKDYSVSDEISLILTSEGKPKNVIDNYYRILVYDPKFEGVRFNELTGMPEYYDGSKVVPWDDTKDAEARCYIEGKYEIYSLKKYYDAFDMLLEERAYHPIKERLALLQWDGKDRIGSFLYKCMAAEDTPYTREVSRLIFAGGINRLYNPGCKFDEMPVLIGTRQGEGKSTIVRWLALSDDYFNEVTEFEGQKGVESLEGAWICEVSELLAMTKAKDVEAVKSFITRQNDRYRMPFERRVTDHKRQCIFIGTTNKEQFLTDKTGNRRFYPVRVYQTGENLFNKEKLVKEYIEQCWAQALVMYNKGELKPYADPDMIETIRDKQLDATQDDYRIGMIKDFLDTKEEVCIPMLWYEALKMRSDLKPTRKDSNEIALIMQGMEGWVRQSKTNRFKDYGSQRCWKKEFEEL